MKGMKQFSQLAGAVFLLTGVGAGVAEAKNHTLSAGMKARMDSDKDGRVSEAEYIDFGRACLKERGKPCNPDTIKAKFAGFDRNGDGFITDSDRTFKSPNEKLKQTIEGTWSCEKNKTGPASFIFFSDGQADVIRNGASLREKCNDAVTYRFVPSDKAWACLDIMADQGGGHTFYFRLGHLSGALIGNDEIRQLLHTINRPSPAGTIP